MLDGHVKMEEILDEEEDTHTGEMQVVSVAAFIDVYKPIKKKVVLSVVSSGSDALAKLMSYPAFQQEHGRALVRIAMRKAVQLSAHTVNVQIKLKPRRGVFALREYKQGELELVVFNPLVSIAKTASAVPTKAVVCKVDGMSSHVFYVGMKHEEPDAEKGKKDFVVPFWCMRETLAPNMIMKDKLVKVSCDDEVWTS